MFDTDEDRSLADRRRDATRDGILDAAWALSRRDGLMGWSLRQLAKEVGLAAPSLYAYFDSKHAIYDAMFKQGYETFDDVAAAWEPRPGESARDTFLRGARGHFAFCTSDPTRYQLMFQRVIPDFVPSDEAYGASLAAYDRFRATFAEMGITEDADLDLWTAMVTGLTDQQLSNDPGGDRWERLIEDVIDMYFAHVGIGTADLDPNGGN